MKPASHFTRMPITPVDYATITKKPDLIRTSSLMCRRNRVVQPVKPLKLNCIPFTAQSKHVVHINSPPAKLRRRSSSFPALTNHQADSPAKTTDDVSDSVGQTTLIRRVHDDTCARTHTKQRLVVDGACKSPPMFATPKNVSLPLYSNCCYHVYSFLFFSGTNILLNCWTVS